MSRLLIIISTIFLFFNISLFAGSDHTPVGSRSVSMAHASVTLRDCFSAFNNQAGLTGLSSIEGAVFYESRFLTKELSTQGAMLAMPIKNTSLALSYKRFGFSEYHDNKFGFAVAQKLGETFSLAIQIDYFYKFFGAGYGKYHNIAAEVGLLAYPTEEFTVGAHLFNPTFAKEHASQHERLPTAFKFGISYFLAKRALFVLETAKELGAPIAVKFGVDIQVVKNLQFRSGLIYNQYFSWALGLGYKTKYLTINCAFLNHHLLGISPSMDIGFNL